MRPAPPSPEAGAILPPVAAEKAVRPIRIPQIANFPPMIDEQSEKRRADLARVAWLVTVVICLVTVLILALQGYLGYAGVTFAVAISAAINLT